VSAAQAAAAILARWIKERIDEDVPFIILGDFNRIFETTKRSGAA